MKQLPFLLIYFRLLPSRLLPHGQHRAGAPLQGSTQDHRSVGPPCSQEPRYHHFLQVLPGPQEWFLVHGRED